MLLLENGAAKQISSGAAGVAVLSELDAVFFFYLFVYFYSFIHLLLYSSLQHLRKKDALALTAGGGCSSLPPLRNFVAGVLFYVSLY